MMDKRKEIIKYRFTDPKKAYDMCCRLLEQGIQSGNDYEQAYAYLYMGDTLFSMGNLDEALRYMSISENVQKQNGFDDLLMKTYNIIGVIYITMGDTLLALDYYHKALTLAKKYKNNTLAAMIYSNVGSLLTNIGDGSKAAEYFDQANECRQKKGIDDNDISFNIVQFYMNIGEGHINEKKYEQARDYLDKVLPSINIDDIAEIDRMVIIHIYVMIYYYLGEYDKAYEMSIKATGMNWQEWQDVEVFEDYIDIAEVLVNTGHILQVKNLIKELDEVAEYTDIDNRRLKVCRIRIQMYKHTGQTELLSEQLHRYYSIKKNMNAQRNNAIISAIDNRCRLEQERRANQRLNEDNLKLLKESEIDELTGIYNRFAFKRRYDKLYRYALKNRHTLCVGIFDVDHFKAYNDTYGHLEGDECLKFVARILRKTSDGDYCVARYGGDEFVFMANNVTEDDITGFADRLVDSIRRENVLFESNQPSGHVTISVGAILCKSVEGMKLTELVKQADKVLYEVKQSGRDGYKIGNLLSE